MKGRAFPMEDQPSRKPADVDAPGRQGEIGHFAIDLTIALRKRRKPRL